VIFCVQQQQLDWSLALSRRLQQACSSSAQNRQA
jgi:hypothetical protein